MTTYAIKQCGNRWEIWAHISMSDNLGKTSTMSKRLGVVIDADSAKELVHVLTEDERIIEERENEIDQLRKKSKTTIGMRGHEGDPGWELEVDLQKAIEIIYREHRIYDQMQNKIYELQRENEKLRKETL